MRNAVLLRALRTFAEVDVAYPVPGHQSHLARSTRALLDGLRRRPNRYDLVVVGFYGYLILRTLGPFLRVPVLFDAFISNYDTLCEDRQTFQPGSLGCRLARWLDRSTLRLASHVLLDTPQHVGYFAETYNLPLSSLSSLPVGCREDLFYPRERQPNSAAGPPLTVLSYSSYMPLHGIETVVRAARLLSPRLVHFRLIGQGQTFADCVQLAEGLEHVEFLPPVPVVQLADEIAAADICLGGHFGSSPKAGRVIPGKLYQLLAMEKPVVAADTPANRALLTHRESAFCVPPASPEGLATALLELAERPELRRQLATNGRSVYLQHCSEAVIRTQVQAIVEELSN